MSKLIEYENKISEWCTIDGSYYNVDGTLLFDVPNRVVDCYLAENVLGWKWYDLGKEYKDFNGKFFTKILTHSKPDKAYILEPDTHVGYYSTSLDCFKLVEALGIESIPVNSKTRLADIHDFIFSKVEGLK